MVNIITRENRDQYADVLDDMYRHRHRILVHHLGWEIPGIPDGYDCDAFDTEHTVYLVETHGVTGEVIASARLNPTTEPHMMSEVFTELCEFGPVPRGEDIWELSRVVYDFDRMKRDEHRYTRGEFSVAITEFALRAGIRALSWVTFKELYASLIARWPTRPLGTFHHYAADNQDYIAAISQIDERSLAGMHQRRGDTSPIFPNGLPAEAYLPGNSHIQVAS